MRYSVTPRIGPKILKEWSNSNYREIMLAAMGLELLMLAILVVVEVLDYVHSFTKH